MLRFHNGHALAKKRVIEATNAHPQSRKFWPLGGLKTMEDCKHTDFEASVNIIRLEDTNTFYAEIQIRCAECEFPAKFIGMQAGLSPLQPMMSIDGSEARLPIRLTSALTPNT